MKKTILFVSLSGLFITSCTIEKGELPKIATTTCDSTVHYNPTISNLILTNCGAPSCHGAHTTTHQLTVYSILQGDISNVSDRINGRGAIMPQTGALSASDLSKLNCWISQGAPNN